MRENYFSSRIQIDEHVFVFDLLTWILNYSYRVTSSATEIIPQRQGFWSLFFLLSAFRNFYHSVQPQGSEVMEIKGRKKNKVFKVKPWHLKKIRLFCLSLWNNQPTCEYIKINGLHAGSKSVIKTMNDHKSELIANLFEMCGKSATDWRQLNFTAAFTTFIYIKSMLPVKVK